MSNYIQLNNEMASRFKNSFDFSALDLEKQSVIEFQKEVDEKLIKFNTIKERFDYLVENDFYVNVYEMGYTIEEIEELYSILNSYEFKFDSFMAISKFYRDYAMTTNDRKNYLETYEDRIAIVSLFASGGSIEVAKERAIAMIEQRFQPATPTFMNSGRSRRGELVSCFLLELDDSLNSIGHYLNVAMQLSKVGGGVAINLSKLRSRSESIKGIENSASGVVPVMKLFEDAFSYADQLGQRKGAGAVYLNIHHLDTIEFLNTKKINADEKVRIKSLSTGIVISDKFMELVEKGEEFYMFAPFTVFKKYGIHLDDMDMDEWYDKLVSDPDVTKKKMQARKMMEMIADIQFQSGYPYIVYSGNANRVHALKDVGSIKISNLCTEIFQLMKTSTINNYGTPNVIRYDISCNLGSLNIVNVMERKAVAQSVKTGIDMLTVVSDNTSIENAPAVKKANEDLHSVGLGAMNLHGYLAKNKIRYESVEARDFVRTFFMMMSFNSLERSMEIAKERKGTFVGFEQSEYVKGEDGTFFPKYLNKSYKPKTDKVKALFEGMHVPTQQDWHKLMLEVMEHGIWHSYRLAIAPTQSIAYVQNSTSSVMPVPSLIEERMYGNSKTFYPMPFLSLETMPFYQNAYETNMFKLIKLIAEIQVHVDQGISTILYVDSNTSTRQLTRYYSYAHKLGLKSLYYTRTKNLSVEECESCSV